MQIIQRYLPNGLSKIDPFGDVKEQKSTPDGNIWYFNDRYIGLIPGVKAGAFEISFMVGNFNLIVTDNKRYPEIKRSDTLARLGKGDKNSENVRRLIDLVLSDTFTYTFITDLYNKHLLTFSKDRPDGYDKVDKYTPSGYIPLEIYSSRAGELSYRLLKKTSKLLDRLSDKLRK